MLARGGNDVVCLGDGRDIVKGGAGDDIFLAEAAPDENDNYYGTAAPRTWSAMQRGPRQYI